jgi:hypothetical protein
LKDIIDQREQADRRERNEPAEPTEPKDRNEPTDPMDRAEPMDPIERTEPLEQIDSTEPSDQSDKRDPGPFVLAIPPSWAIVRCSSWPEHVPQLTTALLALGGLTRTLDKPTLDRAIKRVQ